MRLKESQIPALLEFLRVDFPELILATGKVVDTESYWNYHVQKVNECMQKYCNNRLVIKLIIAYSDYLDEYARGKRKNK